MNSTHLSNRLQQVASHVIKDSRLADIGSDHAYLPIYLAKKQVINYGVVGEVAKGPLNNAVTEITKNELTDVLHPRLADGLAAIEANDQIDVITIAGMGGKLISHILESGKEKLTGKERLILQPNVGSEITRAWLMKHHYEILTEEILEEDGHIYEIIVAEKTTAEVVYSHKELTFGPHLLNQIDQVFIDKWQKEKQLKQNVINSILKADNKDHDKVMELKQQIDLIEEVLSNNEDQRVNK